MAVRTISTRLAIEGEAQYRAALTNINSELRTLQSALKLTQSDFAGNANSMAALTAKGEVLKNLYDAQARKVQELSAALQNAQGAVAAYQQRNDTLRTTIDANSKALSQMDSATQAAGREWADQAKVISAAEAELKKLQRSSGDTGAAQADLKAKIDAAKQKMAELEKSTGGAAKAAGTLIIENEKLNAELSENEKYLAAASRGANDWQTKLNNAKVELNELDSELKKNDQYLDEAANSANGCAESIDEFGKEVGDSASSVDDLSKALAAAGMMKVLDAISDAFDACVDSSTEFESAMAGVAKTTDMTLTELSDMGDSIKDLSTSIPLAATELAGIAEVAGQLGVAKDDLLAFTSVMADLGVATNMTSSEAATLLAQFAAITGMDGSFFSNLGSAIVALGNNFATNERKIAEMSQNIAGAATSAHMAESDMLALSAAVTSLGVEAAMGGTQISKLIRQMQTAVETGEGLEEWAAAAGMSASEFSRLWGENATAAIQAFIGNLNHMDSSASVVLGTLGITETRMVDVITRLANAEDKTGTLTRAIELSSSAWAENNALTREALLRYQTTESRLQLLKNAFENVKIAVGDQLTPALGKLYDIGADVLGWISKLINNCKWLVPAVTAIVAALAIFTAGVTVAAIAMGTLGATIKAATLAMATNPIFMIITAVAALGVALAVAATSAAATKSEFDLLASSSQAQAQELSKLRAEYERACEIYGETSAEAAILKAQVDAATESFNSNKQSAAEVEEAHRAIVDAHNELISSYRDLTAENELQKESNSNLITRLQQLLSVEGKTAETKRQILAVVEALNATLPELGLAYDEYADKLNMSVDAIKALAAAEADRAKQEADWKALVDLTADQADQLANVTKATEEAAAAQKVYEDALAAYNAEASRNAYLLESAELGGIAYYFAMRDVESALHDAEAAQEAANGRLEEAQAAADETTAAIDALAASMSGMATETTDSSGAVQQAASDLTKELQELAKSYKEAYDSARESLDGQYALWDKVEGKSKVTKKIIDEGLASQKEYYKSYSENLQGLLDRDIPGIEKLAATFTTMSDDSAAALANLATASDEEIARIIASMSEVDAYKDTLAAIFAELDVDLQGSLDTLSQNYADTITEITGASGNIDFTPFLTAVETAFSDIGVTFETAGTDAGTGLATGIEGSQGQAEGAATAMAQAVIDATRAALQSHSPSQVMHEIGAGVPQGLADGIDETAPTAMSSIEALCQDIVDTMTTAGVDSVDGFMSGFEQITSRTQSTLSALRSVISSATSGLSSSMYSVGAGMVNGMISGLNSRSSALYSTVRSIVNQAIATAKSAAATRSPSKKTQAIFEDVGEGMIVGLDKKAPRIDAKVLEVVDHALDLDLSSKIPNIADSIDDSMPDLSQVPPAASNDNRSYAGDTIYEMHFEGDMIIREEADIEKVSEAIAEKAARAIRYQGGSLMGGRL